MTSMVFPRLLPQVDQAVEPALRGRTGNDNRPRRAVRANARALEIGDLLGQQAGQRECGYRHGTGERPSRF